MLNIFKKLLNPKTEKDKKTPFPSKKFTGNIQRDEKLLRETFKDCGDVKFKAINVPAMGNRRAVLTFTEGLTNPDAISRDIVSSLLAERRNRVEEVTQLITVGETSLFDSPQKLASEVLSGKTAIVVDGETKAVVVESKEWPMRAIEEPLQERLIRGPREGFTEIIQVNLSLIRRRLPDPNLKVINTEVGQRSRTKVAIMYIEDVCDLETVSEVKERIDAINIDGILDPGAISELITERTFTPFPLMLSTERPDKVMSSLMQGKVAIVSDGSPFVLVVPATYTSFFQIPEDYYMHPLYAFLARVLRGVGVLLGTTFVAAYTAVITFHYEMIPPPIVVFIAETREGVPFNPVVEALLLEFAVELMREASIRLPGPIGPTLGIVGALILGQAAVEAQLVSPVLLIVVATAFIAGSIVPNYEASLVTRWIRFPLLLAAGFL